MCYLDDTVASWLVKNKNVLLPRTDASFRAQEAGLGSDPGYPEDRARVEQVPSPRLRRQKSKVIRVSKETERGKNIRRIEIEAATQNIGINTTFTLAPHPIKHTLHITPPSGRA